MAQDMNRPTAARTRTQPIPAARTNRRIDVRGLTSMPAGKVVPLTAFPLLREDRLNMSRFRINFEMMETVEILMNPVYVRVMAYLVPNLAFDRFNGIDQLNRSYMKQPETDGGTVTPFFSTAVAGAHGSNAILKYLGKHARPGQTINNAYIEAYNEIWNFRATNRSPDIDKRLVNDQTLAKAFWVHENFSEIVPDFDQAVIDGEVPLNVTASAVTLKNTQVSGGFTIDKSPVGHFRNVSPYTAIQFQNLASTAQVTTSTTNGATPLGINSYVNLAAIAAELAEDGITVSLSNIELARKTQAFAALRKQFSGHTDDYIIDLLMGGISVPEQAWRQPILLGDRSTIFGMNKRYSTTADDLTASVVNGGTFIDINIGTPVCPVGGVVMITAEAMPEQLFERQMDPYMFISDTEQLPEFLRDTLDPEKVEIVQNQYVDIDHDTPTATFGYAPLNHKWAHMGPGIGGKFFRPEVDAAFDEDRQRIWAVETANPTLSEDFYLCSTMHTKPFAVTDEDPFEAVTRGIVTINGLTVLGRPLIEATDDYEQIMAEAPLDRIDKPVAAAKPAEATESGE